MSATASALSADERKAAQVGDQSMLKFDMKPVHNSYQSPGFRKPLDCTEAKREREQNQRTSTHLHAQQIRASKTGKPLAEIGKGDKDFPTSVPKY